MNKKLLAWGLVVAGGMATAGEWRMDRSKLQIEAVCIARCARTEAHIRELRDCGIDYVYGIPATDRAALDLCAKYGIGVIATGAVPFWHGMRGDQAGMMRKLRPLENYVKAMEAYVDHPAIWMLDFVDEPSALDFPYIGEVMRELNRRMPTGVMPYVSLYPNYASAVGNSAKQKRNQLGTATYAEHVAAYFKQIPLDYVSFDFYIYSETNELKRVTKLEQMHDNFRLLAEGSRATDRSLWFVGEVNSPYPRLWISENQLRFQAYMALCYGAEAIAWSCWSREKTGETPDMPGLTGWWKNNVLTMDGKRTRQYAKLKRVNAELHALGPRYMKYRTVATRRTADGAFVIGEMVARDGSGRTAQFVLAAADPFDVHPQVQRYAFAAAAARVYGGEGEIPTTRAPDGKLSFELKANGGALVEFGDPAAYASDTITVMSYNTRFHVDKDGPDNTWEKRVPRIAKVVRDAHVDLIGFQEITHAACAGFVRAFPEFEFADGPDKCAGNPIAYRLDRFERLDSGVFYMSERPDDPKWQSWGSSSPRQCRWARLKDRKDGRTYRVYCMHPDWKSGEQRAKGMELVLGMAKTAREAGDAVILIGDMNDDEGRVFKWSPSDPKFPTGESIRIAKRVLKDTFDISEAPHFGTVDTSHGFSTNYHGRIDRIFVSPDFRVLTHRTHNDRPGGGYPSDHDPISARLVRSVRNLSK